MPTKIPKRITCKFDGFYVEGVSTVFMWGGGKASVEMRPFYVENLKDIPHKINDGGFGVELIDKAECRIYAVYSNGIHGNIKKYYAEKTIQYKEIK